MTKQICIPVFLLPGALFLILPANLWAEVMVGASTVSQSDILDTKPFTTRTTQGSEAECTPLLSTEDIKKSKKTGNISYECRSPQESATKPQSDERGEAEAEKLKDELLKELGEKKETIIEVPVRDVESSEQTGTTPVAVVPAPSQPALPPEKRRPYKPYASLRVNYNKSQHVSELSDGASRLGVLALKKDENVTYTGKV